VVSTLRELKAGELRHRIQFQYNSAVADADTGTQDPAGPWKLLFECWAKIEDLSGSEQWLDETNRAIASHLITCRGARELGTLTAAMRIQSLDNQQLYGIVNINDVEERGVRMEIACMRETG
jgi:head-tail adaptor